MFVASLITVAPTYCPAVLSSASLLFRVTPDPAAKVIAPAPFCTKSMRSPTSSSSSIVTVVPEALFTNTVLPASPATIV